MSSIGTIWTYPFNPRAMKVQAVAAMNGRAVDLAPDFVMGETNKTPEFLADFPMGRSDAIAQYVAESGPESAQLLGTTAEERAVIRQWIGFADHELFGPLATLILWRYGMASFDQQAEKVSFQSLIASLEIVEKHLKGHQYIATQDISLADISVAAGLYWGFAQVIDAELRDKFPQTTDRYLRVIQDERLAAAFGDKNFIETRKTAP